MDKEKASTSKAKEKLFTNRRTLEMYGGIVVNKQLSLF